MTYVYKFCFVQNKHTSQNRAKIDEVIIFEDVRNLILRCTHIISKYASPFSFKRFLIMHTFSISCPVLRCRNACFGIQAKKTLAKMRKMPSRVFSELQAWPRAEN